MEWVALAVAAAAAYLAFMRPSQSCVDGIWRDAVFAAGGVRSLDSKVAKALKDITALKGHVADHATDLRTLAESAGESAARLDTRDANEAEHKWGTRVVDLERHVRLLGPVVKANGEWIPLAEEGDSWSKDMDARVAALESDESTEGALAGALDGINRLSDVENRLAKLEGRPDHLKHEVSSINRRVVVLENTHAPGVIKRLAALEKKDAKLEGRDRDALAQVRKLEKLRKEDISLTERAIASVKALPDRINERVLDTLESLDEESTLGRRLHELVARIKSEAMSRGREVKALKRRIAKLEEEWGE